MVMGDQRKRTVYLNKDLDTEVRVFAAKADKNVSIIIDEALRMYLKAKKGHG
jgi:hypothetical protein